MGQGQKLSTPCDHYHAGVDIVPILRFLEQRGRYCHRVGILRTRRLLLFRVKTDTYALISARWRRNVIYLTFKLRQYVESCLCSEFICLPIHMGQGQKLPHPSDHSHDAATGSVSTGTERFPPISNEKRTGITLWSQQKKKNKNR